MDIQQDAITIRTAQVEDAAAIAKILQELNWFEHINGTPIVETHAAIARRISQCLRECTHTILVAQHVELGVIGYVSAHWYPNLLHGHDGHVSELFLLPSATGQGTGHRLLKAIEIEARRRGCTRLTLVNRRMRESYQRGFYKKMGWQESPDSAYFVRRLGA
ncbi:MAG TPA: GNAT family N-acetyltransferase [Ktedonobacteraceae bacterium]